MSGVWTSADAVLISDAARDRRPLQAILQAVEGNASPS